MSPSLFSFDASSRSYSDKQQFAVEASVARQQTRRTSRLSPPISSRTALSSQFDVLSQLLSIFGDQRLSCAFDSNSCTWQFDEEFKRVAIEYVNCCRIIGKV